MGLRSKFASLFLSLALRLDRSVVEEWFWEEVEYLSDEVLEYLRA